ncbi:MAG: hypothetical protein ACRD2W_17735 [Acidimicrobiales bacterium]
MKRFIAAGFLATGLSLAVAGPAGAIIINGGAYVSVGNPDIRVAADAETQPCVAPIGGMIPCIAEGGLIIQIRVATEPVRS